MFNASEVRQKAIQTAKQIIQAQPVFLDTETTGLNQSDEIIEICVVDAAGQTLLNSFVRPSKPIPVDAMGIHGINDAMVQDARPWPEVWLKVRPLLSGKLFVAYNAEFDLRMMRQSYEQYRLPWRENLQPYDLLKLYSKFRGIWDTSHRNWKYFSLDEAGKHSGIALPNAHRALADTLLARELLIFISNAS